MRESQMTAPAHILERMARAIDPSAWRVFDGYLADVKRKYKGEDGAYDPERFKDRRSIAQSQAALDNVPGLDDLIAAALAWGGPGNVLTDALENELWRACGAFARANRGPE